MSTVTVYSNWEPVAGYEFETLEEARDFARAMRDQQYKCIIDSDEQ